MRAQLHDERTDVWVLDSDYRHVGQLNDGAVDLSRSVITGVRFLLASKPNRFAGPRPTLESP